MTPPTPLSQTPQPRQRRRRFNPWKTARLLAALLSIYLLIAVVSGGKSSGSERADNDGLPQPSQEMEDEEITFSDDQPNLTLQHLDYLPEGVARLRVNPVGDLATYFNDSNAVHLAAARRIGIEPLKDLRSCWQLRHPLTRVATCRSYYVDRLEYSRPYLVVPAEKRLREIGRRFRDTLEARGGGDYRIKVTSLLRTPRTVALLRKKNKNAIDSSVHRLGTTFDISYATFVADNSRVPRSIDDLAGVLAEVLSAMRREGKIYVKYEKKQPCFHITARK